MITSRKWLELLCQNQLHPLLPVSCCVPLESHRSSFFFSSDFFSFSAWCDEAEEKGAAEANIHAGASRLCSRWLKTFFCLRLVTCDNENFMFQKWTCYSLQTGGPPSICWTELFKKKTARIVLEHDMILKLKIKLFSWPVNDHHWLMINILWTGSTEVGSTSQNHLSEPSAYI